MEQFPSLGDVVLGDLFSDVLPDMIKNDTVSSIPSLIDYVSYSAIGYGGVSLAASVYASMRWSTIADNSAPGKLFTSAVKSLIKTTESSGLKYYLGSVIETTPEAQRALQSMADKTNGLAVFSKKAVSQTGNVISNVTISDESTSILEQIIKFMTGCYDQLPSFIDTKAGIANACTGLFYNTTETLEGFATHLHNYEDWYAFAMETVCVWAISRKLKRKSMRASLHRARLDNDDRVIGIFLAYGSMMFTGLLYEIGVQMLAWVHNYFLHYDTISKWTGGMLGNAIKPEWSVSSLFWAPPLLLTGVSYLISMFFNLCVGRYKRMATLLVDFVMMNGVTIFVWGSGAGWPYFLTSLLFKVVWGVARNFLYRLVFKGEKDLEESYLDNLTNVQRFTYMIESMRQLTGAIGLSIVKILGMGKSMTAELLVNRRQLSTKADDIKNIRLTIQYLAPLGEEMSLSKQILHIKLQYSESFGKGKNKEWTPVDLFLDDAFLETTLCEVTTRTSSDNSDQTIRITDIIKFATCVLDKYRPFPKEFIEELDPSISAFEIWSGNIRKRMQPPSEKSNFIRDQDLVPKRAGIGGWLRNMATDIYTRATEKKQAIEKWAKIKGYDSMNEVEDVSSSETRKAALTDKTRRFIGEDDDDDDDDDTSQRRSRPSGIKENRYGQWQKADPNYKLYHDLITSKKWNVQVSRKNTAKNDKLLAQSQGLPIITVTIRFDHPDTNNNTLEIHHQQEESKPSLFINSSSRSSDAAAARHVQTDKITKLRNNFSPVM